MSKAEADGGYALIFRRILDNEVFRDHGEAMAFAYLILRAAWRPTRVRYKERMIVLERGQLAMSVRDLAAALGRERNWADRFLKRLADRDMIETASETGVNVVSICNYDAFQSQHISPETGREQQPRQHRDSAETQNKEEKQVKKERTPYSPPSQKRATQWPSDQQVPIEWLKWAMQDRGWTGQQAKTEAQRFVDSALAKGRTYIDWQAAWRQWCRSSFQKTVGAAQQPLSL
jgi:hypothetical protein